MTKPFVRARQAALFVCLIIAGLVFATNTRAASFQVDTNGTLTTSLVSFYKLENASDSLSVNDLTNNSSTTFTSGLLANAADFGSSNSSKYLDRASETGISTGSASRTVAFWMKSSSTASEQTLFDYGTAATGQRFSVLTLQTSGNIYFSGHAADVNGNHSVTDGNWHFIVVTYDGTTATIYVDNTAVNSSTVSLNTSGTHLYLAQYISGGRWYSGKLDEVGIWNKVLSSQERTDLYNGGAGDSLEDTAYVKDGTLKQLRSDATTTIAEGATTNETTVVFSAQVYAAASTSTVQLQVEVATSTGNFTGQPTVTSTFVSSGVVATTSMSGLADGQYLWQARVLDSQNNTSTWKEFGMPGSMDFQILTTAPTSTFSFAVDSSGTLTANLVSYYMSEDTVDSWGRNNLTNNGSVTFTSGKINNGADFGSSNSSEYLDKTSENGVPTGSASRSVAFWMKSSNTSAEQTIFDYGAANTGQRFSLLTLQSSGNIYFSGHAADVNGNHSVTDGQWHFIVVTYDGTTVSLYVDNSLVNSAAKSLNTVGNHLYLAQYVAGGRWYSGQLDELGIWSKVLSAQERADLYNGGGGDVFTPPTAGLNQYKSDATTTISAGASTTESYVKFGATLNSNGTSTLQLQIEVQPTGSSFTNTPNATSSFVASGTFATAVFGTSTLTYPRDPESWSNGSFHWQARLKDANGATSTWQLFGANTSSTDFAIDTVPLYVQKSGPWPSTSNATDAGTGWWHNQNYDNGTSTCGATIGFCGCAISSVAMWMRYYGITTDHDGNDVNPGRLNTWLRNPVNAGYNFQGDLNYDQVPLYASSSNGGTIIYDTTSSISGSYTTLKPYIDPLVTSSTPDPVILYEQNAPEGTSTTEHTVIATGLAYNAGTSTYTIRDPVWYNTKYLNQATSTDTSSTVNGYSNKITRIHVFYDPPSRPSLNDISINLPNTLILVDSQGRRTGKNPTTGIDYHEIPGTTYFEEFHSGQLYFHSPPAGRYTIYILGGQTGEYHLDSWVDDGAANHPHQVFSGNIQAGMMIAYTQNYNAANIPGSTPLFRDAASSTESITSAPAKNLPAPPVPVPTAPSPPPTPPPFYPAAYPGPTTSTISDSSSTVPPSTFMQTAPSSTSSATSTSQ